MTNNSFKIIYFIFTVIAFTNCNIGNSEIKNETIQNDTSIKTNADAKNSFIAPPNADYTGDYVDKYPNGIIKFTGFYRFGKRHGQWISFYDNGNKWSECFYDNDKRNGQSIVYFPNGNIQYTGWYKKDLKDSIWFFYDINKKEIDKRTYRNGEETGLVN